MFALVSYNFTIFDTGAFCYLFKYKGLSGHALIDDMPNDRKDRHVLAAAIATYADVLVTANLKDFKPLPGDCEVEVQHPNEFLSSVLDGFPSEVFDTLRNFALRRREPMNSVPAILTSLHKTVPDFVMQAFDALPAYIEQN